MKIITGPHREMAHLVFLQDYKHVCGPYWRSLIQSYNLDIGDTIEFQFKPSRNYFEVYAVFDQDMEPKNWLEMPCINLNIYMFIFIWLNGE